jgi:hypothetical protein
MQTNSGQQLLKVYSEHKIRQELVLTVSAYMTLAPPPATIVQMRPFGFKTVNLRDALVWKKDHVISHLSDSSVTAFVIDIHV